MSFLTILLVASAFYFAHARPDSQSWSKPVAAAKSWDHFDAEPTNPANSSASVTDPKDDHHQMHEFINKLSEGVDKYMTPLMSKLDVQKQDEMKNMCVNAFASYINYLLLLIGEIQHKKGDAQTQAHEDSYPRNEMMIQFESLYQLDPHTPYMANTEGEDEEDEEE